MSLLHKTGFFAPEGDEGLTNKRYGGTFIRSATEDDMYLIDLADSAADLRVMQHSGGMGHDIGSAADRFGSSLGLIQAGDSRGADSARSAYDWWPLTLRGDELGELRDDATGLTIHINAS